MPFSYTLFSNLLLAQENALLLHEKGTKCETAVVRKNIQNRRKSATGDCPF